MVWVAGNQLSTEPSNLYAVESLIVQTVDEGVDQRSSEVICVGHLYLSRD